MNSIAALIQGIGRLRTSFGLWSFLYLALLLFALSFALPINTLLEAHLGNTLELQGKPGTFDYTLIADLINNQKTALSLIIAQGKWIILLFIVLSVFLRSGIIAHFFHKKESFQFSNFVGDCTKYFWRFLRATLYFLVFHGALLAAAFFLFQSISGGLSPFEIEKDADLVNAYYITVPIYLGIAFFLIMANDLTKFEIIHQDKTVILQPILTGFKKLFKHFFYLFFFYLLLLLLFFGSYNLFQFLKNIIAPTSGPGVWLILIVGQVFIFIRIGIGLVRYAGLDMLRREYDSAIS